MPIARITAAAEHLKPARAADAYAGQESLTFVRCSVITDDGLVGHGVTGRFLAAEVVHLLQHGFADTVAGLDPLDIEAVAATLAKRFNPRQSTGVFVSAMSALDLALWDLKGQRLGLPVATLIGGARGAVPAYATVGLPAFGEAELVQACISALAEGYRGVKILVGAGRSLDEDVQRIRAVRRAIGHAPLMLDANCAFSLAEAKRLASRVADCDIAFFEEPLRGNDLDALAELRRAVPIPRLGADDPVDGLVPRGPGAGRPRLPAAECGLLRRPVGDAARAGDGRGSRRTGHRCRRLRGRQPAGDGRPRPRRHARGARGPCRAARTFRQPPPVLQGRAAGTAVAGAWLLAAGRTCLTPIMVRHPALPDGAAALAPASAAPAPGNTVRRRPPVPLTTTTRAGII